MNQHFGRKYYQPVIIGFLTFCIGSLTVHGQLSRPGHPYPLEYKGSPCLRVYELSVSEEQKAKAFAVDGQSMLKPAKSGMLIDVLYTPESSGTWDTLSGGTRIWRAAFHIEGASFMSLVFNPFHLDKGVRVFLYNKQQHTVLGAFTDLNNKLFNLLATAQIPGDTLVVEIQVPGYLTYWGSLAISGIACDFSNDGNIKLLKDGWFGKSGDCNIDINCDNDSLVQLQKNAVVRVVFNGSQRCTGTLVNNTMQNGINYLLTAEHCINQEDVANAAVFYFDYESPYCDGPDGKNIKSLSGATIRATSDKLDFTLLELVEPVPFTYQPYYAGWDYSGNQPNSGYIIHHPQGDVKKISRENHPLSYSSFGGYDINTHWLVNHWETGTTEPGSSGGAIFDQYGRIAGTLTGGNAYCASSIDDFFQMFSHCWLDYPSRDNQLACWLDPDDLNQGLLDGFDPYRDFRSTGDTLTNILPVELLDTETGTLEWGSYSGHNAALLTGFAEKYSVSGNKKMLGLFVNVADNYIGSIAATIIIKVWSGINLPGETLFEMSVPLADLSGDTENFIEFDSIVSVGKTFFVGYELQYLEPQDTFSSYMAENRLTDPVNTAFIYDGYQWQSLVDYTNGAVNTSFAVMPVVFDSIPENTFVPKFDDNVIAYPNPAGSYIWLEFREISVFPVQVSMFNMQGQKVLERNYGPYQRYICLEQLDLCSGIYLIRVKEGNSVQSLKVAILK